nr:uncharacterized protein LOC129047917 [Pongo abelii]XP_054376168.1 uncharacterized protein LOC129047917 [Pongo abelii]XP_054376169.1 uncharacterized protein LOC129047917 [Pongo abelii]
MENEAELGCRRRRRRETAWREMQGPAAGPWKLQAGGGTWWRPGGQGLGGPGSFRRACGYSRLRGQTEHRELNGEPRPAGEMKGGWCESVCQGQKDTEGRQAEPRECALAPEEDALGWLLSYREELQGLEGLEMLRQKLEGPCLGWLRSRGVHPGQPRTSGAPRARWREGGGRRERDAKALRSRTRSPLGVEAAGAAGQLLGDSTRECRDAARRQRSQKQLRSQKYGHTEQTVSALTQLDPAKKSN